MATIRARKRTDGSISYTAQIRLVRDGTQVYQESQTFARKEAAKAWVRNREAELDQPGAIERANRKDVATGGFAARDESAHCAALWNRSPVVGASRSGACLADPPRAGGVRGDARLAAGGSEFVEQAFGPL